MASTLGSDSSCTNQQVLRPYLQLLLPELRNQIYDLCFVPSTSICVNEFANFLPLNDFDELSYHPSPSSSCKALLDTCTEIRNEASGLYYARTTFVFSSAASFLEFATIIPPAFTSHIEHLHIVILNPEHEHLESSHVWRVLSSTTSFARLAHLDLRLNPTCIKEGYDKALLFERLLELPSLRKVQLGILIRMTHDNQVARVLSTGSLRRLRVEGPKMMMRQWTIQINQVLCLRAMEKEKEEMKKSK